MYFDLLLGSSNWKLNFCNGKISGANFWRENFRDVIEVLKVRWVKVLSSGAWNLEISHPVFIASINFVVSLTCSLGYSNYKTDIVIKIHAGRHFWSSRAFERGYHVTHIICSICTSFDFWSTRLSHRNSWSRDFKLFGFWSKSNYLKSFDHNFGGKVEWIKNQITCICRIWYASRDMRHVITSFKWFTGSKIISPRTKVKYKMSVSYNVKI